MWINPAENSFVYVAFVMLITLGGCAAVKNDINHNTTKSASEAPEGLLIHRGVAHATIVVPKDADSAERYAAKDLQKVLYKITKVTLPIATDADNVNGNRILIGSTELTDTIVPPAERASLGKEDYIARLSGRDLALVGGGSYGTIYACAEVYDLLGARWYMPGELGECIPKLETIRIDNLDVRRSPSFEMRWVGSVLDWSMRNRLNYVGDTEMPPAFTVKPINIRKSDGAVGIFHTQQKLLPDDDYFADHPEYFALVNGEWSKNARLRKLCNSNPAVAREVATNLVKLLRENPEIDLLSFSPTDGWEHCECEECRKLDEPNVPTDQQYSRRQMILYNRVAKELEKQFPDQRILVGAYHVYTWPPKDPSIKAHKNLGVIICHYEDYCLAHPTNDPQCPPNQRYLELLRQWQQQTPHIFLYEYYAKVNWRALPWPIVHTIEKDIPFYHSIGIKGLYTQWALNGLIWGNFLDGYVAARLLWDHTADVQSILNEFYEKFYGEAAAPMRRWHETLEDQMAQCGVHMPGSAPKNAHYIFTVEVVETLKQCIAEAQSLAKDELVRRRLERMAVLTEFTDRLANVLRLRQEADGLNLEDRKKALAEGIRVFDELFSDFKDNPKKYEGITARSTFSGRNMRATIRDMKKKLAGEKREDTNDGALLEDEKID